MHDYYNEKSGQKASLVADDVHEIIMKVNAYCCWSIAFQFSILHIICQA